MRIRRPGLRTGAGSLSTGSRACALITTSFWWKSVRTASISSLPTAAAMKILRGLPTGGTWFFNRTVQGVITYTSCFLTAVRPPEW
jgi:hypothetical protein